MIKLGFPVLVLLIGSYCAFGLELNEKEFSDNPRFTSLVTDPTFNTTWLLSVDIWSSLIWNKYDLFSVLKISLGDKAFGKLDETALTKSCWYYTGTPSKDNLVEVIFRNQRLTGWQPVMSPFREGVNDWVYKKKYYGTTHVVLTDNKSFYLGVNLWQDGSLGYCVASPAGIEIAPEDLEQIYKKIESLGFSRKSAFVLRHDCPEDLRIAKEEHNRHHRH